MKATFYPRGPIGDALLAIQIRDVHAEDSAAGTRRVHEALADRGVHVSRKRVIRIMRTRHLAGASEPRKPQVHLAYADRLVPRLWAPARCNQVWVGDTTQVMTRDGWLYLTAWLDLRSRRLLGWAIGDSATAALALTALRSAIVSRRPQRGLIVHTDRGSQFSAAEFRDAIDCYGFTQSMSRRGNCHDNACMESFFSSLKRETRIRAMKRAAASIVRGKLVAYLAGRYNDRRRHSSLGGHTPAAFERLSSRVQSEIIAAWRKVAEKRRRARIAKQRAKQAAASQAPAPAARLKLAA